MSEHKEVGHGAKASGGRSSTGSEVSGWIFGKVQAVYERVYAHFTSLEMVQKMHMFYILFLLTFLPLPILYWEGFIAVLLVLFISSPLWLFPMIVMAIWELWIEYIQLRFLAEPKQAPILLEIVVPKDIQKSPRAMELFFEGLLVDQGAGTFIAKWWNGGIRPWWSLEIASVNGQIKMYLWTWQRYREHVEAQLYAQYPEVELREAEVDYANIPYNEKDFFWAMQYLLKEPESYPIKTYVDYELDKSADKWETKIDPMVNVLEKFTLAGEGEQIWLQILFTLSKRKVGKEADDEIKSIYKQWGEGVSMLPPGEEAKVKAIERAKKKPAFDCVIRAAYVAKEGKTNTLRLQSLLNMFKSYDGLNRLTIDGSAYLVGYDYPWSHYTLPDRTHKVHDAMNAFRMRSALHVPYSRPSITLTTEELATLFHFPSQESKTPGLDKKQSRTAEPPINLPIA